MEDILPQLLQVNLWEDFEICFNLEKNQGDTYSIGNDVTIIMRKIELNYIADGDTLKSKLISKSIESPQPATALQVSTMKP